MQQGICDLNGNGRAALHEGKSKQHKYHRWLYIVKYPDLSGNIPLKPACGVLGVYTSQLVRYCDINQSSSGFVSDFKDMTSCFLNQGFIFKKVQVLY